jgi:hypothetical protein
MGKKGIKKVTFAIYVAKRYFVDFHKARRNGTPGEFLETKTYVVPPPPPDGAAVGPFPCVKG